jgi:hypothetical protein
MPTPTAICLQPGHFLPLPDEGGEVGQHHEAQPQRGEPECDRAEPRIRPKEFGAFGDRRSGSALMQAEPLFLPAPQKMALDQQPEG